MTGRITAPGEQSRRRSWRTPGPVLVPLGVVWLGGLAVLALAANRADPQVLFFDPAFSGSDPKWYVGAISQLGVLGWAVAVLSAGWSAWFAHHVGRPKAARFLARGATATAVLLFDDLFAFHAAAGGILSIPKPVLEVLVTIPCGIWVVRHLDDIQRTRWPLLFASVSCLALSMAVERATGNSLGPRATIAEDGPKFLGILAWATYFALTSFDIARSVLTQTHTRRPDEVTRTVVDPEPVVHHAS